MLLLNRPLFLSISFSLPHTQTHTHGHDDARNERTGTQKMENMQSKHHFHPCSFVPVAAAVTVFDWPCVCVCMRVCGVCSFRIFLGLSKRA